jgi:hypothetical protein
MPRPTEDDAVFTRTERKVISMRGEAIHLITQIESFLDIILITSFIKPEYENKFYEILMWEDFRLSTKVRLFAKIDLPTELQAKQKEIVKTLLNEVIPTRNRYAHLASIILVHSGVAVSSWVDKGHKMSQIADKDFKVFRGNCDRVRGMLEDVFAGILIHSELTHTAGKQS